MHSPKRLLPDAIFVEAGEHEGVVRRSVRGGVATFAAQGARFAVQTLTTVILARLLTPDDFGLVAMVALVMGFAQSFKDAGLSTATVQRESITREQVDALFWVNVAVSTVLALLLSMLAPAVAAFFHRPELAPITVVLSASFVLGGLSVQHDALLRRHLRFGALATTQVAAQVANLAVAVAVALVLPAGRYWALVAGVVASVAVTTVLTFYYCPFVPGRFRRSSDIRGMLFFGGQLMGFETVNYFARNFDNLLVGRILGAQPLGLYAKAYQLFMLPITQIRAPLSQVALPALSRLRSAPDRYRRYYARLAEATAVLTVPVSLYCLLEAAFLIQVLLGSQWMGAARTLQILAVAGIFQPAASTVGLVMISQGRADRQLKNGLVNSAVLAAAFVIGIPFGIEGVAAGFTIGSCIVIIPMLFYGFHGTPVRMGDFARAVWPSLVAGAVASSLGLVAATLAGRESVWGHVALATAFAVVYTSMTLARRSVKEAIQLVKGAFTGPAAVDVATDEGAWR